MVIVIYVYFLGIYLLSINIFDFFFFVYIGFVIDSYCFYISSWILIVIGGGY